MAGLISLNSILATLRTTAASFNSSHLDKAAIMLEQQRGALEECEEYFDQRADAEYFADSASPVGNEEMRLLVMVREALGKVP